MRGNSSGALVNCTTKMIDTLCFPPTETCWHAFPVATVWLGSRKLIQEKNCQIISAAIQGLGNEGMFTPNRDMFLVLVVCRGLLYSVPCSTTRFYLVGTIDSDAHTI
jgi:hypothetical protein